MTFKLAMLLLDLFDFAIILSSSAFSLSRVDLGLSIGFTMLCTQYGSTGDLPYLAMLAFWTVADLPQSTDRFRGCLVTERSPIGRLSILAHEITDDETGIRMDYSVPPGFYKMTTQHALPSLQNPPTQDMSRQPYTPSTTRPSFPCPNPMCGKIFNTSDLVCQHLAIPDSYCSRWAMDIINRMHRSSDVDNGKGFFSHRLR